MQKQLMKSSDYFLAVRELAQELAGSRLDNIYDAPGGFRLRFRKLGGEHNLLAEPGVRIHLTKFISPAPPTQSSFTQLLRRELANALVKKVAQVNCDRIAAFEFLAHGQARQLVFEQFGKGNAFLLDENGRILRQLRSIELGGRKLARGMAYEPPAQGALMQKLSGELAALEKQKIEPTVFYSGGKPVAFSHSPEVPPKADFEEKKAFPTFNEALDEYYSNFVQVVEKSGRGAGGASSGLEKQLSKLEHSLEQMRAGLPELEKEEAAARRAGELIYENYAVVEQALIKGIKKGEKELTLAL